MVVHVLQFKLCSSSSLKISGFFILDKFNQMYVLYVVDTQNNCFHVSSHNICSCGDVNDKMARFRGSLVLT